MIDLILIGAGGHCKSVCDSLDLQKFNIVGFIDEFKQGMHINKPILGNSIKDVKNYNRYSYFVAIGDNEQRKKWFKELQRLNLNIINIIDKSAIVSSNVKMGIGNFIGKLAIINSDVIIGDNNIINTKALIEHECIIGNNNHISTNSTLNGNVKVKNNVFFGSAAVCNGQLKIENNAIIGSGSVIINDAEEFTTVVGVPGKVIRRRK